MSAIVQSRIPHAGGVRRRLLEAVASPQVFDFWASRVSRTWTWERPLARVVARREAACDAVTLVLRPNRHWRGFVAGQHVNIGVEIDGRRVTRSYSPSVAPEATGCIEITVKRIEGGKVSRHLCMHVRPGDVLDIGQAFGTMALPAADVPLLLLAAGSGITPLMAMLRARAAQARRAPATLVYWVRTREERCFADELRAMAADDTGLALRMMLTRDRALAPDEAEGRIDAAHVRTAHAGDTHVFACGPGAFVAQARALVQASTAAFTCEAFTPPPLADLATGTVAVTLARSGRTLQLPRDQSLLVALEAKGIVPASGCRMGICNTCACGKSAGTTRHLLTGDVEPEPLSALRLCINAATTDLVLDL